MFESKRQGQVSRREILYGGVAIAGASVLASTTLRAGAQTSQNPAPFKGAMGLIAYPFACNNLPTLIASKQGYFKENQLELEVVSFSSGSALSRALDQGEIVFGASAVVTVMSGFSAGLKNIRGIGSSLWSQSLAYAVRADSGINSPADLAGKKIADVGGKTGITHWLAAKMLEGNGLSQAEVEMVALASIPDNLTGLLNGIVDVAILAKPYAKEVSDGTLKILWDPAVEVPELVESGYWTRPPLIEEQASVVQRFIDSHARAMQWIRENREEAARVWAEELKIPVEATTNTLTEEFARGYDIRLTQEGFESNKKAGIALGVVKEDLTYDQFVVSEFFEKAYDQFGK